MAVLNGLFGRISGKLGDRVYATWQGKQVVRKLPVRKNKVASPKQLIQQEKFGLIMGFMGTITPLVNVTFATFKKGGTNFNAAVSYNFINAIDGEVSPFNINFSNVLVSKGDLQNATNVSVIPKAKNKLQFNWAYNGSINGAKPTDKVILVVYCAALKRSIYVLGGNIRISLTQTINVAEFTGETVETWIAFITANDAVTSNSIYTGSVNIKS